MPIEQNDKSEVLPATVVDRRGSRVGVARRDLHVAKRHSGVERRHDEARPKHVRVNGSEACSFADRMNPPVSGAPVETLPVFAAQDRPFVPFADGEIDCSRGSRHERDRGGLVALSENVQGPVSPLKREVLDVCPAGLRDA